MKDLPNVRVGVPRAKAALSSGCKLEVTKWLKPSISVSRIGDSASVQAARLVVLPKIGALTRSRSRDALSRRRVGSKLEGSRSLECWALAISAVGDARRLQRAICLLLGGAYEYLSTRLNLLPLADFVGHHDGLRCHNQLLLPILVFDRQHRSIHACDRVFDISVRHLALG